MVKYRSGLWDMQVYVDNLCTRVSRRTLMCVQIWQRTTHSRSSRTRICFDLLVGSLLATTWKRVLRSAVQRIQQGPTSLDSLVLDSHRIATGSRSRSLRESAHRLIWNRMYRHLCSALPVHQSMRTVPFTYQEAVPTNSITTM